MNWKIQHKIEGTTPQERLAQIESILFQNRHLNTSQEQADFMDPQFPDSLAIDALDIDKNELNKAVDLINNAIKTQKPIIVYGDYDCDGLCATATLWETLKKLGANTLPFIPHRINHGYGLSETGLASALALYPDQKPLVITVDNGISASQIAENYRQTGGQIIITDHHQLPQQPPVVDALVHTTTICGTGIAWVLSSVLLGKSAPLELVSIATICDQLPLLGVNRQLVTFGLKELKKTNRPGLKALTYLAGIESTNQIETYQIGFIIGPRLNAAGRLGDAMIALRLLCTTSEAKAWALAQELHDANSQRQDLTSQATTSAIDHFRQMSKLPKILTLASDQYHEGIIGLIAARLSDQFGRPAIVISTNTQVSKGSARSVSGVHITQILQQTSSLLVDFGGHEQAAGLSINTPSISAFQSAIETIGETIDDSLLVKTLNVEAEIKASDVTSEIMTLLKKFAPFGIGNPQPLFASHLKVIETRRVGKEKNHLQLTFGNESGTLGGIAFNIPSKQEPDNNQEISAVYAIEENTFRGNTKLQLRILDFQD